jgi:hypothetical protein
MHHTVRKLEHCHEDALGHNLLSKAVVQSDSTGQPRTTPALGSNFNACKAHFLLGENASTQQQRDVSAKISHSCASFKKHRTLLHIIASDKSHG